jgi:uncharacterized Fe-S center protein
VLKYDCRRNFMTKSKVYFSKEITPESLIKIYDSLGVKLDGKVAVKLHSGEKGNQNYLQPEFVKPIINKLKGTVVECNTAYQGARNTTEKHKELMAEHGWSKHFDVDILDSTEEDLKLEISGGEILPYTLVGGGIKNYNSTLVLSHFKGHPMGGYGGALKQLSIGFASSNGKAFIHSGGRVADQKTVWKNTAPQNDFLKAMAEAASAVAKHFEGKIAYINVMCNMSVDCDCCAVAEDPCMKDIGVLASLDPIALDQACIDLVYSSKDKGRDHLVERIESRNGLFTIECANNLNFGTTDYELVNID